MGRKRKSESKRNRISFFAWSDRLVCEWNLIFKDATTVVTGDGPETAIGIEKESNQFFAWGDRGLLFCHPLFQAGKALLGRLLDEGHVFGKMLLRVDLPFLATL